jgi:hypothetical protein
MGKSSDNQPYDKIPCGKCGLWVKAEKINSHPPCNGRDMDGRGEVRKPRKGQRQG